MQQRKDQLSDFKNQLKQHDQYKNILQKLSLLKQGLRNERMKTQQINQNILSKQKACEEIQCEILWKDDMRQSLQAEVRCNLKQILQVRARKRKLLQQMRNLSSDNQSSGHEGAKSIETSQN